MPDPGLLRGVITLVTLLTFMGICWWAYRPGNRRRFDRDAWLVFDDNEIETFGGQEVVVDRKQRHHEEGGRA